MSQNFASSDVDNKSKYVTAHLDSFKVTSNIKMSQQSASSSLLESLGGITGPSLYDPHSNRKRGGASKQTIIRLLTQQGNKQIIKDAQTEFEKQKEKNEEEPALSPSGGEGKTFENTTNTGESFISPVTTTPTPETGQEPATTGEYAAIPTNNSGVYTEAVSAGTPTSKTPLNIII